MYLAIYYQKSKFSNSAYTYIIHAPSNYKYTCTYITSLLFIQCCSITVIIVTIV